jgi:Flp pilus assembly protein TadG
MFFHVIKSRRTRLGTILVVLALTMVVLFGILGFAVDLGRIAVCRSQLQNAADASALAGAAALGTDGLIMSPANYDQSGDIATARLRAQTFGQGNKYDLNGSTGIILDKSADVDVGNVTYPVTPSTPLSTTSQALSNAVRVRTRVDATHGGNLKLLFAPVINKSSTSLLATSTAMVEVFQIDTIQSISGDRCPILPITMSLSDWQKMVNNQTGIDIASFNSASGQVVSSPDGLQEQQLYPGSNGTSSNNGLLQFGTSSHSNSVLSDEIVNGPDSSQVLAQWPPNGSPPWDSTHSFMIGADPGWRATNFDSLAQAIGQVRVIPINDGTSPGNGANGAYRIVMLAPVRIMSSIKGGNGKGSAMVQPAVLNAPTIIPSKTILSTGSQGGVPVVRLIN